MTPSQRNEDLLQDDLCFLRTHMDELKNIHSHLRWLRFGCWCKNLPMLIKASAVHIVLAYLHLALYPEPPNTPPLMRAAIWVTSYTIVISTVYIATHAPRRQTRAHWVQG